MVSSQRRTTPSMCPTMLGASTRNPHKRVEAQKRFPQALPPRIWEKPVMDASTPSGGLATCLPTPSAVSAAAFQRSASVPRRRNSTDNMLGSARPMKQVGIQMTHWSRTTCRYHRRQRGRDCRFTSNTDPTWGQGDPLTSHHAGDGAHMMSHAPTLLGGEVADGSIAQPSVAGDGGDGGDKGDQGEIDGGENPPAEPGNEQVFDVGAVRISIPVQVLVFHQLPPGAPLPGVRPSVAIGVDGRLQPLFDHVQMAVPIPILAGVQPSVAVAVLAAEDGNGSELERSRFQCRTR